MEVIDSRKVLVVGTEPLEYGLLESMLEEYHLTKVIEAHEVVQKVLELEPDLIICDFCMMGSVGMETLKELHNMMDAKMLPIILFIASNPEEDLRNLFRVGVADFITKPYNELVVQSRVRNYIELKRLRNGQNNTLDSLTGIGNRQRLIEDLRHEWDRAKRNGTVLSVMIIDIDAFKLYNEAYGNDQGDRCLHTIAQNIAKLLNRPSDMVARWGSEEFACILPETDLRGTLMVGESIRKAIFEQKILHVITGSETSVTVSVGIASMRPARDGSCDNIIRLAEKALDAAKEAGGNRVEAEMA